jgi:5-formyltetrahydrofolate cyclo-ligase
MTKEILRKELLEKRKNLKNKAEKDVSILNALINQDFYKNAKTVMVYVSYNCEVDTRALIEKMLLDGKKLAAPKCITKTEMEARAFFSFSELNVGAYGISEPSGEVINDFDLIIKTPGISLINKEFHVEITSQFDLLLRFADVKLIGITGTKGKSTTSSLIYEIIKNFLLYT